MGKMILKYQIQYDTIKTVVLKELLEELIKSVNK